MKLQINVTNHSTTSFEIQVSLPSALVENSTLILEIESDRNRAISKFSDRSPHRPDPPPTQQNPKSGGDVFYPVKDLEFDNEWKGIFEFTGTGSAFFQINPFYYTTSHDINPEVTIPAKTLEPWENAIYISSSNQRLSRFYLRLEYPISTQSSSSSFHTLSEKWTGEIRAILFQKEKIVTQSSIRFTTNNDISTSGTNEHSGCNTLDPRRINQALNSTLDYLLRSQNQTKNSPTYGSLFLFYDLDACTYRAPHWIWGCGPSVQLMLDCVTATGISLNVDRTQLKKSACLIGEAGLRWQEQDPTNSYYGLPLSRFKVAPELDHKAEIFYSPADSSFFAKWAWISLYKHTGDERFLNAAKLQAHSIAKLLTTDNLIKQDYWVNARKWSDVTIDEAGFGTESFDALYEVTSDKKYRQIAKTYIDQILKKFEQEDGRWSRSWNRKNQKLTSCFAHTRGLGWAMEGLLAAARLYPEDRYLDAAKAMAQHFINSQHNDGYWTYLYTEDKSDVGISEKGTALWSLLFYELNQLAPSQEYLTAARKALGWCLDNIYRGEDPNAHGGIVGCSPQSAVVYRPWFRVSCAYTSAFAGLAMLKELEIQKNS